MKPITVDANAAKPVDVFANERFEVQAVGVHHGIVPRLGYLITVNDTRIGISGDQNLETDYFTRMIEGADLFVMPMAVPESDALVALHVRPSDIGKAAREANVEKLILSHWMARSLAEQRKNIEIVERYYGGSVAAASDLMCVPVKPGH